MTMMFKSDMHGLSLFISDIRNCTSKEAETKRIYKELANIRSKFGSGKILEGCKKKKYICKLIYIFLLGHNFEFGDMEAVNLLTSGKYSEKFMGYLFISIVRNENSSLMRLIIRSLDNDLTSYNDKYQNLALTYIGNMANNEIAETLGGKVLQLTFSCEATAGVRQSAVLCLLKLFKLKPDIIPVRDYPERIVSFLSDQNLGVVTAAVSLIEALAKAGRLNGKSCMSTAICRLNRVLRAPCIDMQDYNFYLVCAPWLCVKLLRLLQCFDFPSEPILCTRLTESLEMIFNRVQEPPKTKKLEHRLSKHAVMFEAVKLTHQMKMVPPSLRMRACNILDMGLKQKESNIRYLSLEGMKLLSECEVSRERIKHQLSPIIEALNGETDICIRQMASSLLCVLCDKINFKEIISQMFIYLETSSTSVREETVLKISLLAEKYVDDSKSYVDAILKVLRLGGEYSSENVWFRFIQIVGSDPTVQGYAAKRAFEALQSSKCNESLTILVAYVLGEFGNLIAGDNRSGPFVQLNLLHSKFQVSSPSTRALLLTTYVKLANLFPEVKNEVKEIFRTNSDSPHAEIQQRAVEYLNLLEMANDDYLATILDEMPCSRRGTSVVESALRKLESETAEEKGMDSLLGQLSAPFQARTNQQNRVNFLETYSTLREEPIIEVALERSVTLPPKNEPQSNFDLLANLFNTSYPTENPPPICRSMSESFKSSTGEELIQLIWHKSGILFDNNILRVYMESQFRGVEGRIRLKYFNKTPHPFISFLAHFPFESYLNKWTFIKEPCATTIEPNTEIAQEFKVECLQDFNHMPSLSLSFLWAGTHQAVPIQFPMTLNKFVEPAMMSPEDFMQRWNNPMLQHMEVKKRFAAKYIIDKNLVEMKLDGFGVSVLQNVDLNPENYVCSGMFQSRTSRIGILLRLQPDHQTYTYQLTVRAPKREVAEEISKLLEMII